MPARLLPMTSLDGLDLRHLQALTAVASEGTFGRAADALGYSQSAVSQQIAALERIVGEPVFERPGGPRPVRLTPVGRLLLGHADQILSRIDRIERDLRGHRDGTVARLDLGVFQSAAVKVLPAVVGRLKRETPGIDVRPKEDNDDRRLVRRVVDGELDLSFVGSHGPHEGVELVELCIDPYVVVAPAGFGDGPVQLDTLAEEQLVGMPPSDTCQIRIEAGLLESGIAPDYVFRTNDNAAIQSMVRAGMGLAVMPLLAVDTYDPGTTVLELDPPMPPRTISVALGPNPTPAARRFAEVAKEVCAREPISGMPTAS